MKKITFVRRTVQILAFILLIYGAYIFKPFTYHGFEIEGEKLTRTTTLRREAIVWAPQDPPVVDTYPPAAICRFNPRGGMFKACILHFLSENFTWGTHFKYLLVHLFIFLLLAILLGRWWCGWICPMAFLGDSLIWLRKKLGLPYKNFTPRTHKYLAVLKYFLLALTLFIPFIIWIPALRKYQCDWSLPFCQLCPGRIIFPLFGVIFRERMPNLYDFANVTTISFTIASWIFLIIFLMAFFFGRRVWCRICPIGVFIAGFNRGGALALKKDGQKCNKCGYCIDACPVENHFVYEQKGRKDISHNDCVMCMRCVEICPQEECLRVTFLGKTIVKSSYRGQKTEKRRTRN